MTSFVSVDVAMAPNNNEVHIHQFAAGKWNQSETLSEHGQRVTGIDWAASSNRIVTCGAVSCFECIRSFHFLDSSFAESKDYIYSQALRSKLSCISTCPQICIIYYAPAP